MMRAYWRERFRPSLFVPAAVVLAIAARAGTSFDVRGVVTDGLVALVFLAQFRLWDDLADRQRDRARHPARVLVAARDTSPFVALCVWLGIVNICIAAWRGGTLAASLLGCLDAGAAIWYASRSAGRTVAGDLVLLAKYPAFVLLLSTESASPLGLTLLAASAVYAGACAFEIWHDPTAPMRVHHS